MGDMADFALDYQGYPEDNYWPVTPEPGDDTVPIVERKPKASEEQNVQRPNGSKKHHK